MVLLIFLLNAPYSKPLNAKELRNHVVDNSIKYLGVSLKNCLTCQHNRAVTKMVAGGTYGGIFAGCSGAGVGRVA